MIEDRLTRDQRIALESVAQANLGMGYSQGDDEFDQTLVRAARIERFIRKRDDDAVDGVPVLRDGDTVVVQPDKFTTQDEVDSAAEVWRREFGDRVQVTFLGWPVTAIHRPSTGAGKVAPASESAGSAGAIHIGHAEGRGCTPECSPRA